MMNSITRKELKLKLVEGSAVVSRIINQALSSDTMIEVVETYQDEFISAKKTKNFVLTVIILDSELLRMDAVNFIKKIVSQHRTSVDVLLRPAGRYAGKNAVTN